MKSKSSFLLVAFMTVISGSAQALADGGGCTIEQVMNTVHQNQANRAYKYSSDYAGSQGQPTQKQNEDSDQYLFWVGKDGETCPAIVTYDSGECTSGVAVIKTADCQ
jgi:hypothetical protein